MKFLQKKWNDKSFTETAYVVLSYEQLLQVNGAGGSSSVSVNSSLSYSSHSPRILNGVISMFHGKSFCQSCSVWA